MILDTNAVSEWSDSEPLGRLPGRSRSLTPVAGGFILFATLHNAETGGK